MKPGLLFSVVAIITIIILSSFSTGPGEWMGIPPADHSALFERHNIDPGAVLYVCPAESTLWDDLSNAFLEFRTQILMIWAGLLLFLVTAFGWAFYQNLIKNKFEEGTYVFAITFARGLFWITVIMVLLIFTPNHFKSVGVVGSDTRFVLCQSTTPDSRPVRADAVVPWRSAEQ